MASGKPKIMLSTAKPRILGAKAVAGKMAATQRKMTQAQQLGGYWMVIRGKPVFVRTHPVSKRKAKKPLTGSTLPSRIKARARIAMRNRS